MRSRAFLRPRSYLAYEEALVCLKLKADGHGLGRPLLSQHPQHLGHLSEKRSGVRAVHWWSEGSTPSSTTQ